MNKCMRYVWVVLILGLFGAPEYGFAASDAAGSLAPLRTIDASDHQFDDLAAFGRAVGDARVVVLGEQTHGEGNVYALKVRLVEYLHEVKGFNVLALESGFFDGARVNQAAAAGKPLRDAAVGSLFFMYANSRQVKPVFDYIDSTRRSAQPMWLTTFNSQMSGLDSQRFLLSDLVAELQRRHVDLPQQPAWRPFAAEVDTLLHLTPHTQTFEQQQAFYNTLARIDAVFAHEQSANSRFWHQVLVSLDNQAQSAWSLNDLQHEVREAGMARNMRWLLQQQYPQQKVIVWTYVGHGAKHRSMPLWPAMMQQVRATMPDTHFYHVVFTGFDGTLLNYETRKAESVLPHDPASLEYALHQAGVQQGFLDLVHGEFKGIDLRHIGQADYDGSYQAGLPLYDEVDGVFYLDRIEPALEDEGLHTGEKAGIVLPL